MTTSPKPSWSEIKALFEEAVERPAAEREAYLASIDAPDAVRAEVRSLLAHAEMTLGVAAAPAALTAWATAQATGSPKGTTDRADQHLGPWRLTTLLGAGGMGEVWAAERADGAYQGRAAVKVLKRGLDSAAVLARFDQEKSSLARLQHPHIAQLLDAGLSPDGMPYFVMEYVEGQPIDQAVQVLNVDQRLGLFLQLADAVAHAHRHLLVHRDLKPANVLVDTRGQVKLLDFGIAKALDPAAGAGTQTQLNERPFTPHYASPEQVRGEPISTATDVYSLGVMLYVLLTGERPYGRDAKTPLQAAQAVVNETPTRPSRLSHRASIDPNWAQTRQRLAGDLDNILLKALEKDPAQRYASVDALGQDIRSFLAGFPVSAHAASWRYVARKFVARHRWAVVGTGLASVAVLGALGAAAWQGQVAKRALGVAELRLAKTRDIVDDLMSQYIDAWDRLPQGYALKADMLSDMAKHLEQIDANNRAAGIADLDLTAQLAMLYARLAETKRDTFLTNQKADADESMALATKALDLFAQSATSATALNSTKFHGWWARTWISVAHAHRAKGHAQEALKAAAQSEAIAATSQAPKWKPHDRAGELGRALLIQAQLMLGASDLGQPNPKKALELLTRAEEEQRKALALVETDSSRTARMAGVKRGESSLAASQWQTRHALATILGAQALAHTDLGNTHEAFQRYATASDEQQRLADEQPGNVLAKDSLQAALYNTATLAMDDGQPAVALQYAQRHLDTVEEVRRMDPGMGPKLQQRRLLANLHLARIWAANGQSARALSDWQALIGDSGLANTPAGQWRQAQARCEMAMHLASVDQADAARKLALEVIPQLETRTQSNPKDRPARLYLARMQALMSQLTRDAASREWQAARGASVDALTALAPLNPRERRLLGVPP